MSDYSVDLRVAEGWWNSLTAEGQAFYRGSYFMKHGTYVADDVIAYWAINNIKDIDMASITPADRSADFIASESILENRRKIVFCTGRDLNLRDVLEVNVEGSWWRIKTKDGKLHLVDPAKVNYASIA